MISSFALEVHTPDLVMYVVVIMDLIDGPDVEMVQLLVSLNDII